MLMIAICQEMKWTYQDFINQPKFFIDLLIEKIKRDNKEQELKSKRHGR